MNTTAVGRDNEPNSYIEDIKKKILNLFFAKNYQILYYARTNFKIPENIEKNHIYIYIYIYNIYINVYIHISIDVSIYCQIK